MHLAVCLKLCTAELCALKCVGGRLGGNVRVCVCMYARENV